MQTKQASDDAAANVDAKYPLVTVRASNAVYRPEAFLTSDGRPLYGSEHESMRERRQRSARQLSASFSGEKKSRNRLRVLRLLTDVYRRDPCNFFRPIDVDSLVFDTRDRWYAADEHVRARMINPQFRLFNHRRAPLNGSGGSSSSSGDLAKRPGKSSSRRDSSSLSGSGGGANKRKSGSKARDAYENQLERCRAPDEQEILNAKQMSVTFFFEYVRDIDLRLRQLGGRQHNKSLTYISTFVAVYNADPAEPLTVEMRERLDGAKSKRTKTKIANAYDRQMYGIVSTVVESILAGEGLFMLHVYDILLGEVGRMCAPETHKYLTRVNNDIRSEYLQLKHSDSSVDDNLRSTVHETAADDDDDE